MKAIPCCAIEAKSARFTPVLSFDAAVRSGAVPGGSGVGADVGGRAVVGGNVYSR